MYDLVDLFFSTSFKKVEKGHCKVYLDIDPTYNSAYIGFAGEKDWKRPYSHKKDLLTEAHKQNPNRRVFSIEGLSYKNARVLEAFLIKYGQEKYGLTKPKGEIKENILLNKRRERVWEKYIEETLVISS